MSRTENPLKSAFWLFIAIQGAELVIALTYVFYTYGAVTDIGSYGWGHVPIDRLQVFIWLSDNFETISRVLTWSAIPVYIYLIYQTASLLDRLSIKNHLSPGMTAGSMFIPFYSFYRPWAGLAEVANTLSSAIARRSISYVGVRGTNGSVLLLAFTTYAYMFSEKIIGQQGTEVGKLQKTNQQTGISYLSQMTNLFWIEILLTLVFVGVVAWFWTRIIRQYHECIWLPNASIEPIDDTLASTPQRDVLNVGTNPAL